MADHGSTTGRVRAIAPSDDSDTGAGSTASLFGPNNTDITPPVTTATATATQTSHNPCFLSIGTQMDDDDEMAIQKLEDEVTPYKAIADKAKERLEEARREAEKREAALRKTIEDQTTQLHDTNNKITTMTNSFQDIATTQIATVTKELVEMQTRSSQFL